MSDAIPALLAGNTVVLKPDEKTTRTAVAALEILREAGLPEDVMQVLPGTGEVVGQAIARECDYLMFTGSTPVGRQLGAIAGERLIGFSAELGGKNPLLIAPDADIPRAVQGARQACFTNSGQLCISIERIYVHAEVADVFLPAFLQAVGAMRVAGGREWSTDMGSLISPEHLARVSSLVDDAVARGATVLTGGHALPELGPTFYAPTVLTDVPEDAELLRSEVFGPVVAVEVVGSIDEAVARANDSELGLNASVWAAPATGRKIASRLEFGTVNINDGFAAAWASLDAPMGGWKASGMGRRHADEGLLKYTEARTVAEQRLASPGGSGGSRELVTTALKLGKRVLR